MANIEIRDGAGSQKYLKATGTGTDGDPFVPEQVTAVGDGSGAAATAATAPASDARGLVVREAGDYAPASPANVHAPSANTAAVVTYTAGGAGVKHTIRRVVWSYSAAPTGGSIKIEDGASTVFGPHAITAAGPGFLDVDLIGTANTAMVVTLAAGGSGVSGVVSVVGKGTRA